MGIVPMGHYESRTLVSEVTVDTLSGEKCNGNSSKFGFEYFI